jgi:hypothetical protein
MESHDHAMFTGVNASLITALAGIEPTAPGYETIEVAPVLPTGLDRAAASLQTVRGEVASGWQRSADGLVLAVTVPANATAEVRVPMQPGDAVSESGVPAAESPGVSLTEEDGAARVYALGSGEYLFTVAPAGDGSEGGESGSGEEGGREPVESGGEPRGGGEPAGDGQTAEDAPPGRATPFPAQTRSSHGRPRLRLAARAGGRHRAVVTIACGARCPRHLSRRRVRVTVATCGRRHRVLARIRARFAGRRIRLAVHSRPQPIPARLRVRVDGLGKHSVVRCVRLRHRR